MRNTFIAIVVVTHTFALSTPQMAFAQASAPGQSPPQERQLSEFSVVRIARLRLQAIVLVHAFEDPALAAMPGDAPGAFGSGVIIDAGGLVITNAHVVAGLPSVHVRTSNGEDLDAQVLGRDDVTDLALLKVSLPSRLIPAPLGHSDRLEPGQFVVALGNPIELHHSVTLGVISAVDRSVGDDGQQFIQTDASINPGSSGGALFDLSGRLIGITTAMLSRTGEDAGLNFAIPIDVVRDLLPQLKTGTVVHGWIGAALVPLPDPATGGLHGRPGPTTLRIGSVTPDGPAARAGLAVGDVILQIGGKPTARARDMLRRLRLAPAGTTLSIRIRREGRVSVVRVDIAGLSAREQR